MRLPTLAALHTRLREALHLLRAKRLHAIRDNVIAKMNWQMDLKAMEVNKFTITKLDIAPLGNDELKAVQNALKARDITPHLTEKGSITVTGYNASVVENLKRKASEVPPAAG